MVNGISGIGAPQQERPKYDKLTLVDTKTNKKTTYYIPAGKNIVIYNKSIDMTKTKGELILKGTPDVGSQFYFTALTLEHMDVNNDYRINNRDSEYGLETKINQRLKNTPYQAKPTNMLGTIKVEKGEGGATYFKDSEPIFQFYIKSQGN